MTVVRAPAVLLEVEDAQLLARLAALGVQLLRQSHRLDPATAAAAERLGHQLAELEHDEEARHADLHPDGWVTTADAARHLGITTAAIRQRAHRGTLESRRVGRTLLVRL